MLARAIRSVLYTLVLYKLKRNHRSHQFSNLRVFHRSLETRYYLTSRFYRQLFPFPPNYPRVGYSTREFRVLELADDDFHKILLSNQSVESGGWILPRKPARNSFGISFRAIGQKVGLYREEGISEETRENRITAIGNDLYSANSRSFLNPFLGILRRAPLPSRKGDAASRILFFIYLIDCPRNLFQLLSPPFSIPSLFVHLFSLPYLSISPLKQFEKFLVRYTFPRAEIVLSRKSCSSSTLSRSLLFSLLLRGSALRHVQTQKFGANFVQA